MITVEKFHAGTVNHVAVSLTGKKIKRAKGHAVCGARLVDMIRLAPHDSGVKEPPINCRVCLNALVAMDNLMGGQ